MSRKCEDIVCRKCGQNAMQASERGAYLARVNPKGEPSINECRPNCFQDQGRQEEAVLRAITGETP